MARVLVVNNVPYEYPEAGDAPGWGEEATGWAEGVTEVLGNIVGPNDILESSAIILNNQTTPLNVSGLLFDPTQCRRIEIKYTIYRITDDHPYGQTEEGTLYCSYDNSAPIGQQFKVSQEFSGSDAGVDLEMLDSGQIVYTSTDLPGANYVGLMRFFAQVIESTL